MIITDFRLSCEIDYEFIEHLSIWEVLERGEDRLNANWKCYCHAVWSAT